MKTLKTQSRWIIDAVLFAGFICAVLLDLTGLAVHQWLGIAIGALALYHLFTHWSWVNAVTGRFFRRTSQNARLYYLIDVNLGLGFILILVTGLVMSTWLSLPLDHYTAWKNMHILATIAALLLLVVKIGLHRHWIVQVARRAFFPPRVVAPSRLPALPGSAPLSTGRRDFMKLMGVVGGAAFLALGHALYGMEGESQSETLASQQTANQNASSTTVSSEDSTSLYSVSPCSAVCPRGCSYPGHCRRYTDSNGNGRCDLGECA